MTPYDDLQPTEVEVPAILAAQISSRCGADPGSISQAMCGVFGQLAALFHQHRLTCSGPARAIYTSYGAEGVTFTVALPLAAPPVEPLGPGAMTVGDIPGGKTLRCTHRGPYRNLMQTYGRITEYLTAQGMLASEADWAKYMPMWEEYMNNPQTTPEADLLTYIHLPLR